MVFSTSYPWTNRSGIHWGEVQLSDRRRWTVQEELGIPNGPLMSRGTGQGRGSAEDLTYRSSDTTRQARGWQGTTTPCTRVDTTHPVGSQIPTRQLHLGLEPLLHSAHG